ncbi:MAG: glycosyltransferase family 4 protein, partial [Sphingomonadales bacterium]|nr:glycosyltransferase family 4 protein [Sphingomonadales bacterium]
TAVSPVRLLSVGTLCYSKDYLTLLRAFKIVLTSLDAKLTIVGEGPCESILLGECSRLSICDQVRFVPFTLDLHPFYVSTDIFVLSSLYEGLGNVLVEALSYGIPVVSTDCDYGPREILNSGKYGLLVPPQNPVALATAVVEAASRGIDPRPLISRSCDFSVIHQSQLYLDLLDC